MLAAVTTATRAPEAPSLPFRDGEIIAGKYEVERVLGQGGMGVVVSAHHIALQQKVAIKLLLPTSMGIPGAAPRFLREARSAVAIQSEHVARVLDVGTLDSGQPFMVMEYLTGSDLGAVLRKTGRLPMSEAVDYVLQACEAIAEAHARGIVHRDLKPDNIFLTRRADGSSLVKILDFGLSKPAMEETDGSATPSLTGANMVAGSPQYMSPEQVRSLKNVDHRTDIWSLGVLLYELLTGQRPFEADTIAGVFAKIAADAPLRPRTLRPEMPPSLETVVMRCLEKDIPLRIQDVPALATALLPFAPPASRTSVERIVRLGAPSLRALMVSPATPSLAPAGPDSMEVDIPTMAAPTDHVPGAPPPALPSPSGLPAAHSSAPHGMLSSPSAEVENPLLRSRAADMLSIGLELASLQSPHPVERARLASRPPVEEEPPPAVELHLGRPIAVLVVAILVAAADMVLARIQGTQVSFGPVTPLWLAGPLAVAGSIWLVLVLLKR